MKAPFIFLLFFSLLSIVSCKKDSDNDNPSSGSFIEITVNGKTYNTSNYSSGSGFGSVEGCYGKPTFKASIGQIDVSTLFFDVYLTHYENNTDFTTSSTGQYKVYSDFGDCNLDLGVSFTDKSQSNQGTTLQSGSNHTVTKIKQVDNTSTEIGYFVSGTFSCSFKNSQGQIIPVTGKYQTNLYALK